MFLHKFEGKLYRTAGAWPAIPITKEKSLFEQLSAIGRQRANIEGSDYVDSTISSALTLVEGNIPPEFIISKYTIQNNCIAVYGDHSHLEFSLLLPNGVAEYEVSGYAVIEQWLKYHSYAYYRKVCTQEEIRDLNILVCKITRFKELIVEIDSLINKVLDSDLILPQSKEQ